MKLSKKILSLYKSLKNISALNLNIFLQNNYFNDEPFIHAYITEILFKKKNIIETGYGYSTSSSNIALIKSIVESVERFSNKFSCKKSFKSEYLSNGKFLNIEKLYLNNKKNGSKFIWTTIRDIISKKMINVPHQLIYLNSKDKFNEPLLSPIISTGCAADYSEKKAIIKGIYEIIERDAFMLHYLCNITSELINNNSIKNIKIIEKIKKLSVFKIETYIYLLKTNINIPVYMTILVDKSSIGPKVTFGISANLYAIKALESSFEEALAMRISKRKRMMGNILQKYSSTFEKTILWYKQDSLTKIEFLLNQKKNKFVSTKKPIDIDYEYDHCLKVLKDNNLSIWAFNITHIFFKKTNIKVVKTLIPELQPMWQNENQKIIIKSRINMIKKMFNKKNLKINIFPHPFV